MFRQCTPIVPQSEVEKMKADHEKNITRTIGILYWMTKHKIGVSYNKLKDSWHVEYRNVGREYGFSIGEGVRLAGCYANSPIEAVEIAIKKIDDLLPKQPKIEDYQI